MWLCCACSILETFVVSAGLAAGTGDMWLCCACRRQGVMWLCCVLAVHVVIYSLYIYFTNVFVWVVLNCKDCSSLQQKLKINSS